MTIQSSVFIATSVDGFIAREDGSIDWLERANTTVPPGEDCGYQAFIDTVDVLVMGRKTFDVARGFPQWPYGDKRVVVLSRSAIEVPASIAQTVTVTSAPPGELVLRLEAEGAKRVYVDGGTTIQRFLREGLIDDLTITRIPVLLGKGIPLFDELAGDVALALVSSVSWDFGFVQSTYRVVSRPGPTDPSGRG